MEHSTSITARRGRPASYLENDLGISASIPLAPPQDASAPSLVIALADLPHASQPTLTLVPPNMLIYAFQELVPIFI